MYCSSCHSILYRTQYYIVLRVHEDAWMKIKISYLLFLILCRWAPESLQWLIEKGETRRAILQLHTIATVNRGQVDESLIISKKVRPQLEAYPSRTQWREFKAFVQRPKLLLYLSVLCYGW